MLAGLLAPDRHERERAALVEGERGRRGVRADDLVSRIRICLELARRRRFLSELVQRFSNAHAAVLAFAFERHFDQHCVRTISNRLHDSIAIIAQRGSFMARLHSWPEIRRTHFSALRYFCLFAAIVSGSPCHHSLLPNHAIGPTVSSDTKPSINLLPSHV